ncbi:MAG: HAMP domain-containing protein [Melioribacteraceae bacterium]|nr:HAMP domain-containing protein [Melioribacteraceae bacterium]
MKIFKLLSFKLFIFITILLTALTFLFSLTHLKEEEKRFEKMLTDCSVRASNTILGSTYSSMLKNRKEEAFEIIHHISNQADIEKVRIFNKNGVIIYSSDTLEINTVVDLQNESCIICHTGSEIVKPLTKNQRKRIFEKDGHRVLGMTSPIENSKSCSNLDCHVSPEVQLVLGVLDVQMSLLKTDGYVAERKSTLYSQNISITLIIALSVGLMIFIMVHQPVKKVIIGTKEVSSGNLNYKINCNNKNEIGSLARSFNRMTDDLNSAKKEITAWSDELEKRVEEKTEELKKTQARIIHIEKMASLGKLSATVAHELNNPLAGILTYSKLIQKKLNKEGVHLAEKEALLKYLGMIESESGRCGSIVKNMLLFSKKQDIEFKKLDINKVIDSTIHLVDHHLKINNISLNTNLAENLPLISIDENQIKQALLAIYLNAVEAIEKDGTLSVKSELNIKTNRVIISIQDNGRGIPEKIKSQIFEPFFTTKNAVKGVGLGLSIVYGIIEKHNGEIFVESEVDKGATFIIKLPVDKKE